MSEDKNKGDGGTVLGTGVTSTPIETPKVVNLADFRKNKQQKQSVEGAQVEAKATNPWPQLKTQTGEKPGTEPDPNQRRILISLTDGDLVLDGYLGLTPTFLAIGDNKGNIKFAAAPGRWLYAVDVSDDPDYNSDETTPAA